jgi:crotonobetainyl-CoA:carnitine CoA-transferase CaiB-like acyl-CoA transferase
MSKPMEGVRVVELAAWTFVPAAGAVMAEWGADVVKIEHPEGGDPQRGLINSGMVPGGPGGVNYFIEQPNHNKRSIGLDLKHPRGREVLLDLCRDADVFLTNWLPGPRARARVDVDDIRAVNQRIIYARGHGQGVRGPDADKGGYDGSSFWARSGVVDALTQRDDDVYGPGQTPAFGDLAGGQTIAGAIAAALFRRERTGEPSVVDISLLAVGMWMMSPVIVSQKLFEGLPPPPRFGREQAPNPVANRYRTKDDRVVHLVMLQAGRYWPELVAAIGRPELATDPRFADPASLFANRVEAIRILDETFATRTLDEWRTALRDIEGVWAPAQRCIELYDDPQAIANGYIASVDPGDGRPEFPVVANPVQFDEEPSTVLRAPGAGEHTDEILAALGYDWERIVSLKVDGAVL